MNNKNVHFWHIMFSTLKKVRKLRKLKERFVPCTGRMQSMNESAEKWFSRFRAGNVDLDNAPRSGRPVEVDDDQIKTLTENNPPYTTRVIAGILKISRTAVVEQLHKLGYGSHLDVCDSLYERNENDPFFKGIVTGDKNWIVYDNVERKRSWGRQCERPLSTPKAELHQKKIMLCI
jgi:histone-lysine N-methyltransferase SETMAR